MRPFFLALIVSLVACDRQGTPAEMDYGPSCEETQAEIAECPAEPAPGACDAYESARNDCLNYEDCRNPDGSTNTTCAAQVDEMCADLIAEFPECAEYMAASDKRAECEGPILDAFVNHFSWCEDDQECMEWRMAEVAGCDF